MMTKARGLYALEHADGTLSVMQLLAEVDVGREIARSQFSSPVVRFAEITADEAKAIRDARRTDQQQLSSLSHERPGWTDHSREIAALQDQVAGLQIDLAVLIRSVSDATKGDS